MVSAVSIIDPDLTYPHRMLLAILALHASSKGIADPSQERIATLAGWFKKGKPNASYVSTLINNENHTKEKDRCGPGLVQLGYVKPGHKQKGWNQTNTYILTTPTFEEGCILRPCGAKTTARFTAPVPRENSVAYKARKAEEHEAHLAKPATTKKRLTAEDQLPLDLCETFTCMGDEYTRKDCEIDMANWQDGLERDVPDAVYRYFKVEVPTSRDSEC